MKNNSTEISSSVDNKEDSKQNSSDIEIIYPNSPLEKTQSSKHLEAIIKAIIEDQSSGALEKKINIVDDHGQLYIQGDPRINLSELLSTANFNHLEFDNEIIQKYATTYVANYDKDKALIKIELRTYLPT